MSNIRRNLKLTPGEIISITIGVNKVVLASNMDYGNHRKLILNLKRPVSELIGVPVNRIRFDNTVMPTGYENLIQSDTDDDDPNIVTDPSLLEDDEE